MPDNEHLYSVWFYGRTGDGATQGPFSDLDAAMAALATEKGSIWRNRRDVTAGSGECVYDTGL
jgi:hypothetical protein